MKAKDFVQTQMNASVKRTKSKGVMNRDSFYVVVKHNDNSTYNRFAYGATKSNAWVNAKAKLEAAL